MVGSSQNKFRDNIRTCSSNCNDGDGRLYCKTCDNIHHYNCYKVKKPSHEREINADLSDDESDAVSEPDGGWICNQCESTNNNNNKN